MNDERYAQLRFTRLPDDRLVQLRQAALDQGDCDPRSVLDASERDGATVIIPKGTPQLVVD